MEPNPPPSLRNTQMAQPIGQGYPTKQKQTKPHRKIRIFQPAMGCQLNRWTCWPINAMDPFKAHPSQLTFILSPGQIVEALLSQPSGEFSIQLVPLEVRLAQPDPFSWVAIIGNCPSLFIIGLLNFLQSSFSKIDNNFG